EIEPLAGDRVNAMGGVARQRKARAHEIPCERQPQRPSPARPLDMDLAELKPEADFQLVLENEVVFLDQPFGIFRPLRPYDGGAVALERQDGEWPRRQEVLLRSAFVGAFVR